MTVATTTSFNNGLYTPWEESTTALVSDVATTADVVPTPTSAPVLPPTTPTATTTTSLASSTLIPTTTSTTALSTRSFTASPTSSVKPTPPTSTSPSSTPSAPAPLSHSSSTLLTHSPSSHTSSPASIPTLLSTTSTPSSPSPSFNRLLLLLLLLLPLSLLAVYLTRRRLSRSSRRRTPPKDADRFTWFGGGGGGSSSSRRRRARNDGEDGEVEEDPWRGGFGYGYEEEEKRLGGGDEREAWMEERRRGTGAGGATEEPFGVERTTAYQTVNTNASGNVGEEAGGERGWSWGATLPVPILSSLSSAGGKNGWRNWASKKYRAKGGSVRSLGDSSFGNHQAVGSWREGASREGGYNGVRYEGRGDLYGRFEADDDEAEEVVFGAEGYENEKYEDDPSGQFDLDEMLQDARVGHGSERAQRFVQGRQQPRDYYVSPPPSSSTLLPSPSELSYRNRGPSYARPNEQEDEEDEGLTNTDLITQSNTTSNGLRPAPSRTPTFEVHLPLAPRQLHVSPTKTALQRGIPPPLSPSNDVERKLLFPYAPTSPPKSQLYQSRVVSGTGRDSSVPPRPYFFPRAAPQPQSTTSPHKRPVGVPMPVPTSSSTPSPSKHAPSNSRDSRYSLSGLSAEVYDATSVSSLFHNDSPDATLTQSSSNQQQQQQSRIYRKNTFNLPSSQSQAPKSSQVVKRSSTAFELPSFADSEPLAPLTPYIPSPTTHTTASEWESEDEVEKEHDDETVGPTSQRSSVSSRLSATDPSFALDIALPSPTAPLSLPAVRSLRTSIRVPSSHTGLSATRRIPPASHSAPLSEDRERLSALLRKPTQVLTSTVPAPEGDQALERERERETKYAQMSRAVQDRRIERALAARGGGGEVEAGRKERAGGTGGGLEAMIRRGE